MVVANVLEVSGLRTEIRTRRASVRPVDRVSFTVAAGQTVGLVGESGCGKSMTGLSIMGLLPAGGRCVEGTVRVGEHEVTSMAPKQLRRLRGNDMAMVFQDAMTALNPTLTIGEQIAEPVRIHRNASRAAARERAVEMLGLVGVPSPEQRLRAMPHELSGGLRQRVAIAIALACEPSLVIADEPTTALDVTTQAQILDLLESLKKRLNMGLLLITHDMGVVAQRADTVLVMYAGRIVESSPTAELFSRPRHPYTTALLDSVPNVALGRTQDLVGLAGSPPDLSDPPPGCRFAPRCDRAQDTCREQDPVLGPDATTHAYACFFPTDALRSGAHPRTGADPRRSADPATASPAVEDGVETLPVRSDVHVAVDHVVKEYPLGGRLRGRRSVKAVSDVSVQVLRGETLGLVGESGCGKSTLARLIVGLERPDAGRITMDGEIVPSAGSRRGGSRPQLVFQDPYSSMNPRMRIASVLREPLIAQKRGGRTEQLAAVRSLLVSVGMSGGAAELYPHEFSGGQRQRIGLARALALEPELIVADEPVSALDVSVQARVLNLMTRLQRERGLTYVVISHDLSVVRYLADRIGVMYLGKLIEIGPAERIYDHPAHPYTRGLLDALPVPEPPMAATPGTAVPSSDVEAGPDRPADHGTIRGELPSPVDPPSGCRFRTRCARAVDLCAEQEPPMRTFGPGGHTAACHVPLQEVVAS